MHSELELIGEAFLDIRTLLVIEPDSLASMVESQCGQELQC